MVFVGKRLSRLQGCIVDVLEESSRGAVHLWYSSLELVWVDPELVGDGLLGFCRVREIDWRVAERYEELGHDCHLDGGLVSCRREPGRSIGPLSHGFSASFSRSLRNLEEKGVVERRGEWVSLTPGYMSDGQLLDIVMVLRESGELSPASRRRLAQARKELEKRGYA